MPGGDGTGPLGTGPRWGTCFGAGFRRGRGMGRGQGMGYGRGYAPLDAGSQRQILENRASLMERELAALRDQLAGEKGE